MKEDEEAAAAQKEDSSEPSASESTATAGNGTAPEPSVCGLEAPEAKDAPEQLRPCTESVVDFVKFEDDSDPYN